MVSKPSDMHGLLDRRKQGICRLPAAHHWLLDNCALLIRLVVLVLERSLYLLTGSAEVAEWTQSILRRSHRLHVHDVLLALFVCPQGQVLAGCPEWEVVI